VNVNECLSFEAICNIANELTDELGLDLSFKNVNQHHHKFNAKLLLGKIHLFCSQYTIDEKRISCE
jgi:hypothetical protein